MQNRQTCGQFFEPLYMDEGRDGGEVKLELCPQLNTAAVETKKQV